MFALLKAVIFVFLVVLIDPKSSQVAIGVDSEDKVGVAVKQFDDCLPEVADGAHFKVEPFIFT